MMHEDDDLKDSHNLGVHYETPSFSGWKTWAQGNFQAWCPPSSFSSIHQKYVEVVEKSGNEMDTGYTVDLPGEVM